ncbi:MAG TPA: hypothetical protein VMV31_02045 [Terriglobales bacterium]|nr:hypothetical protein [Terriglobales bacterium]
MSDRITLDRYSGAPREHSFAFNFRDGGRNVFRLSTHGELIPWGAGCCVHAWDEHGDKERIINHEDGLHYLLGVDFCAALDFACMKIAGERPPWEQ